MVKKKNLKTRKLIFMHSSYYMFCTLHQICNQSYFSKYPAVFFLDFDKRASPKLLFYWTEKSKGIYSVFSLDAWKWQFLFGLLPPRDVIPSNLVCDPVIEEHFRRSLGENYKEAESVSNSVSITGSVDDHFAKALGDAWLQIKARGGGHQAPDADPWIRGE